MNHPQARAIAASDFEHSALGMTAAILVAAALAAYAYALHSWPVGTLFWTGGALATQLVTRFPR